MARSALDWFIVISRSTKNNFEIAQREKVWGAKTLDRFTHDKWGPIVQGDRVHFVVDVRWDEAYGQRPSAFPRVALSRYQVKADQVVTAEVDSEIEEDARPLWPDGIYPFRFRFHPTGTATDVSLTSESVDDAVRDAVRRAQIGNGKAYPIQDRWDPPDHHGLAAGTSGILTRYQRYTRKEVHDILAPNVPFTPGAGAWGLHGVVRIAPGQADWVFFVTFGRRPGNHQFVESISPDGVLTWQSQPNQGLEDPAVQEWIRHDPSRNSIHLFLRTDPSEPYWYLGRLAYLDHDPQSGRPVSFRWQILDWDPPDTVRRALEAMEHADPVYRRPNVGGAIAGEVSSRMPFDLDLALERLTQLGYQITAQDLASVILSLKVRPFVIFSGRSGTGKTSLARALAELFGWPFYCVAVSPAWADPESLMGFISPFDHQWHPGALEALLTNGDAEALVCLDEFNVAKVEYYFSDFISAMDYRDDLFWGPLPTLEHINRRQSDWHLAIPAALKVIATMNFDDSVQSLTPRILDRANVIEFDVREAEDLKPSGTLNWDVFDRYPPMAWDWPSSVEAVNPVVDRWIQGVWTQLRGSRGQFGHRVAQEMRQYVAMGQTLGSVFGDDPKEQGEALLDRQLTQRVLTKLHGTAHHRDIDALMRLLLFLARGDAGGSNQDAPRDIGERQRIVQDARNSGHFPLTVAKVAHMVESYTVDGYASYW
ncbi:MAG: DUF3427 domain-containing protein [Firmicutes bacterium]|nr:DUF3427 domain-containing protein [Bacillota bacterium]